MPHPNWKGGRYLNKEGYVRLHLGHGEYILEHRKIMQDHIGRKLEIDEHVHHKNGIRDDNRLENLELISASEHSRHHRLTENRPTRYAKCHPDRKHMALDLCQECYDNGRASAWNKANPEKMKETRKKRESNPEYREKLNEKNKEWMKNNPEKMQKSRKKTYNKYAEDRRERARIWRENNREKSREYARQYHAKKKAENDEQN